MSLKDQQRAQFRHFLADAGPRVGIDLDRWIKTARKRWHEPMVRRVDRQLPPPGETGWLGQIHSAYANLWYVALVRTISSAWGTVHHAAIRNAESSDIPWAEKQWVKNQVFGPEAQAIEVFPAESKLIDEANMYHLWVLDSIPFGLHASQRGGEA